MEDRSVLDAFLKELGAATQRVLDRGDLPSWSGHPTLYDLALLATNDLSQKDMRHASAHVRECTACQERKEMVQQRLEAAHTQDEAIEVVKQLMTEDV